MHEDWQSHLSSRPAHGTTVFVSKIGITFQLYTHHLAWRAQCIDVRFAVMPCVNKLLQGDMIRGHVPKYDVGQQGASIFGAVLKACLPSMK